MTTDPITGAGQMFAMNMFLEQVGPYVTHNLVTEFDKDRTIAWLTGQLDDAGNHAAGGWWWRYDLTPNDTATDVTLTYDWTDTPQAFRDQIGGMPPFPAEFLAESLASLDRGVTGA